MTEEQEVLKDLKEVTLEELDEVIKAVDKQEQEESLEKINRQILIGECEKNIGMPVYISDLKNVLSMLKEKDKQIEQYQNILATNDMLHVIECENKDKQIDLMADAMRYYNGMQQEQEFCIEICEKKECNIEKCKECIKQYYENKAKEFLNK